MSAAFAEPTDDEMNKLLEAGQARDATRRSASLGDRPAAEVAADALRLPP